MSFDSKIIIQDDIKDAGRRPAPSTSARPTSGSPTCVDVWTENEQSSGSAKGSGDTACSVPVDVSSDVLSGWIADFFASSELLKASTCAMYPSAFCVVFISNLGSSGASISIVN